MDLILVIYLKYKTSYILNSIGCSDQKISEAFEKIASSNFVKIYGINTNFDENEQNFSIKKNLKII